MSLSNGLDLKSGKIMVVEDNAATLTLLKEVLQIEGYSRVVCTQDPTQVIDLFKEHNCDLMLLDLMMPKMDGFEVMDRLKILGNGNLPSILVLTALDGDAEQRG